MEPEGVDSGAAGGYQLSAMENQKQRKPRTRKETSPEILNLKKSVSTALKAAWNVDVVRARREKQVLRERDTLQRKLEAQRVALKQVIAAVEAALAAITPEPASPQEATPLLTPEPQLVPETAVA